jgi:site-specific recombinase XerD
MQHAVKGFARSLHKDGCTANTITSYGYLLDQWEHWLSKQGKVWNEVSLETIEDFLEEYAESHSRTSTALFGTCLRSFYSWAERRKHVEVSPAHHLPPLKRDRPLPRYLQDWQVRLLLQRLDNPPADLSEQQSEEWQRNRLIILTFLYTGIRLAECASLRWEMFDFDARIVKILGKGNRERTIPLHPRLYDELIAWKQDATSGPLFISRRGYPLTTEGISQMFRTFVVGKLGIACSAHQLRHTCATKLRRSKADLREIQSILGHANLNTTAIYTAVYDEEKQQAIARLPSDW